MNPLNKNNQRRSFIKTSSLLFAGVGFGAGKLLISCNTEAKSIDITSPKSSGLALRKNIANLKPDDPEIKLLKEAVAILKKRSVAMPLDPAGWDAHGALHATFCASSIYANQMHYSWLVWPWHRLYLWSMEQKLQRAVGEPKLALHYWDWTKKNIVPEHYWGDESNPLFNHTREVSPTDKIPEDFINVGAAFRAADYNIFGGYPTSSKRGDSQKDGLAEQTFHNNIHNWMGGQMATFTESGFDPIFYAHHGNCDRLWQAWGKFGPQNKYPDNEEWLNKKLYATDGNGKPIAFQIKELLDTKNLGYEFENLDFNPTFCNPYEDTSLPVRNKTKADCITPLIADSTIAGTIYKEWNNKERGHITLHFERAELPYHPYCARVFFEYDQNGTAKSTYSGTFTILPILDVDVFLLQNGVYLQLEVSKEIIDTINLKKEINIVLQPVPLPNRKIPEASLRLKNITLQTA